jgi:hypothetical protein
MRVNTHRRTQAHPHAQKTNTQTHARAHIQMPKHTGTHTSTHARTHTRTHAYACTCCMCDGFRQFFSIASYAPTLVQK